MLGAAIADVVWTTQSTVLQASVCILAIHISLMLAHASCKKPSQRTQAGKEWTIDVADHRLRALGRIEGKRSSVLRQQIVDSPPWP